MSLVRRIFKIEICHALFFVVHSNIIKSTLLHVAALQSAYSGVSCRGKAVGIIAQKIVGGKQAYGQCVSVTSIPLYPAALSKIAS